METIELKDGSFVNCTSLNFEEFESLRSNSRPAQLSNFSEHLDVEVYVLKNDEVLAAQNGYYMLFKNVNDLEKILADDDSSTRVSEILFNKNPFGKDFPFYTSRLIHDLTWQLDIQYTNFDEQLLTSIDDKLNHLPHSSEFKKTHLLNFIAVVGEVLIKQQNVKWKMMLSDDNQTWNPYLQAKNDSAFFVDLYEDIYVNQPSETLLKQNYELTKVLLNL